ncbi:MAG: nicotinate-nucleotide adenylyltransferase [Piscinibacter sp.]|nr:nicotinate-nucleotide adenylyltransferase [Piscinibacter sp.]
MTSGPRCVGLFGGSFDPVHLAHLALARSALQALALDAIYWIPAGLAWQKGAAATPGADRAAMVELAIAGEPRFRLERCELERAGPSYTIDTVQQLIAREPGTQWWLVIGQDQFARLATWHRWHELVALVQLAVAARAGDAVCAPAEVAAARGSLHVVPLPPLAISATDIRARVAAGQPIASLVPAAVAGYIAEHGLYRSPPRS